MVAPSPRYATCQRTGRQIIDGSYGCEITMDEMMEIEDPFGYRRCRCESPDDHCKATDEPESQDFY